MSDQAPIADAPTPETDAEARKSRPPFYLVTADFAHRLERERDEARARLDEAESDLFTREREFDEFRDGMDRRLGLEVRRFEDAQARYEEAEEQRAIARAEREEAKRVADNALKDNAHLRAEAARLQEAFQKVRTLAHGSSDKVSCLITIGAIQRIAAEALAAVRPDDKPAGDQWRACAERLAKELRDYDEVLCGGLSTRNALAEFDRLKGKEGALAAVRPADKPTPE